MNSFEKHLMAKYLDKLLPSMELDCYSFGEVFDFIVDDLKLDVKKFKRDKYGNLKLDTRPQEKEFISVMRKEIKKYAKTHKLKSCIFEKQLNIIRDIYDLNEEEYQIMLYCSIQEVNRKFERVFNCLGNNPLDSFTNIYLGMRASRKDRLLCDMQMRDLLERGRRNDYSINSKFVAIFDNKKCTSAAKIIDIILGKREKSELSEKDFEHLKHEKNKVVNILSSAAKTKAKGINILLYGGVGTGKTEFSKLIAEDAKLPIYAVATEKEDMYEEADRRDRLVDLYAKQYILSRKGNACILFDEAEDVMNRGFTEFGNASKGYFNKLLENVFVPVIWTTNNISNVDPAFLRRMTYCIEFEKMSEETRLNIWKKVLKKNELEVSTDKIIELNKNYDIPPSLISNAVQTTKMINGNENDFEGFIENVSKVVNKSKNVKNQKEFEMKDYDDNLVNTDIDIRTLTSKIKDCGKLNFSLCLYGEPGTGKSLYARYLAKQLGVEVIFKRASDLISKWVGQTEQNIAEAFAEAKSKKAMLIFDEADSFLQNRENAQRSWEVSQVNEMLTWMESHDYPFVCTTNLLDTLDEASLRRFTFKIKFDFMTTDQVNRAITHFFNIENPNVNIKGLTAGDFTTVKKKTDFLGVNDLEEIVNMLENEVKVKKSKALQNTVGF